MIDLKKLEKNEVIPETGNAFVDEYKACLKNRGDDPSQVDQLLKLNQERKKHVTEFEQLRSEQNKVGEQIAILKRKKEDASGPLKQMQEVSKKIKDLEKASQEADDKVKEVLLKLPNMCHPSVPVGASEEDNELIREVGSPKKFDFKVKEHDELGEDLGILDFERGAKVAGARFTFLKGAGARLERALLQYKMDMHSQKHGYTEMIPPFIVNSQSMLGTGQFPKFVEDVFHLESTDYYLIPTAETSVTNYYAGEVLAESDLPKHYVAYSPCFRSEAGSHGKDTRGYIRQHQFNKVELLKFVHPDKSYEEHEKLTNDAEAVLQDLEIPYRVMNLCTKDIGFGAAKCFDLEAWFPGQSLYREISSCSNFEDFQARRANIRFRPEGPKAKPQFVHTINGSGLAIGRTVIAIMENYQQEDGSIKVPDALGSYMGGLKVIEKP